MNKKVLLVSVDEVIQGSVIEANVDHKILAKTIQIVQETHLRGILGRDLFDAIIDAVYERSVSSAPISSLYASLIDVCKPYLISKTTSDFIIINNYKITSKGVMKLVDDSANDLSDADLQKVHDYYRNITSTHKKYIIDFLKDNNLGTYYQDKDITSASGWYLGIDMTSEPVIETQVSTSGNTEALQYYEQIKDLKNVLLIGEDEVKSYSVIESNTDSKLLVNVIKTVQQVNLQPILGEALYNQLLLHVQQSVLNAVGIPQLYQHLLSICKDYMINKVVAEFILVNNFKVTNKGVMSFTDNSANAVAISDLQTIKDHFDNISTSYKNQLIEFIRRNDLIDYGQDRDITSDGGWYLGVDVSQSTRIPSIVYSNNSTTDNDTFITGGTFNGNTLSLTSNSGTSVDITGFTTPPPSWSLSGNQTTDDSFIGTLEDKPFIIKTNNQEAVRIEDTGLVTLQKNLNLQVTGVDTGAILQAGTRVFHTAGNSNTFLGANAGNISLSTARENVGIGSGVMTGNTTGNANTALGFQSLRLATSTSTNTAIGAYTLWSLASGNGRQTAVGHSALANLSTPSLNQGNTAVGTSALQSTTTGYANNAVGDTALFANTEGFGNNAFGYFALRFNTTGSENIAFGTNSMRSNSIGNNNIAIGRDALRNPTESIQNIAIGTSAGSTLIGNGNVIIGNNVTLPDNTNNGMNIGGVIFAKNIYTGTTTSSPSVNGQLGINVGHGSITHTLHVSGSTNPVRIEGLQNASDDTILTVDTNGELHTRLASTLTSSAGWYTTGNTGTTGTTNFIGTIDDQPLVFRTNNFERVRILGGAADSSGGSIQFNSQGSPYLTVSRLANNGVSFVAGLAGDIFLNPNTTGRVTIGTDALGNQTSALLQLRSTTRGFLPPRMTTTQRNAIASPATGLMVYDTSVNKVSVYNGTSWRYLQYEP